MARILVVEDEPTIAMGLQDDLRLEGHVVDVIGDGRQAEAAARERRHDLILLDVMLPGKDGFGVCRSLRMAGVLYTNHSFDRQRTGNRQGARPGAGRG